MRRGRGSEQEVARLQVDQPGQLDLHVRDPVAVAIAFDDRHAARLPEPEFTRHPGEGCRPDEAESLVTGRDDIGIDRRDIDDVALTLREIGDHVARAAGLAVGGAKSVKHTAFDWVCGKLRGLQATTSQFKKDSVVLSVPIGITLSASDKGMEGCPPGEYGLYDSSYTLMFQY